MPLPRRNCRAVTLIVCLAWIAALLLWMTHTALAQAPTIYLPLVNTAGRAWNPGVVSVGGHVQKGPFVQGTDITVRELDMQLVPTGKSYPARIDSNTGSFTVRGTLAYPYVELSATGYYFNEVSGQLSDGPLTLRALADLRISSSININLLTHLEADRVLHLVDGGMDFEAAKAQAQQEILAAFNIEAPAIDTSEQLDISQAGSGNAVLLAISAIVQSDKSVAQLTELLSTISSDLRIDGLLNNSSASEDLIAGMEYIKPRLNLIRSNIANRYAALGVPADIPDFEAHAVALDTEPPIIASSIPAQGETTFLYAVVVTFNELLDHAMVNTSTIQLLAAGSQSVAGTVTASDADGVTTVTFKPASLLTPGVHRLRIGSGVTDYAGNSVSGNAEITLTHALLALNVTTYPADGTTTFVGSVSVAFDTLMDHATLNTSTIQVLDATSALVPGTVTSTDADGKTTATFKPASQLAPGDYLLKIGAGIRDVQGGNFTTIGIIGFTHELPPETLIPAGDFQMGCSPDDTECNVYEGPLHTVTLDPYYIDKYEVTNARYAACVGAGGCTEPRITQAVSSTNGLYEYYGVSQYANFSVVNVDWHQADAFCAWEGKRLPTEAEWEKAARGSADTRIYPWGDAAPTCLLANFFPELSGEYCVGATTAAGSYPGGASPYGVMDMSGNVREWVNDWIQGDYYSISPTVNPQGPETGSDRVLRGGSFNSDWFIVRLSLRDSSSPGYLDHLSGFRCAHSQ